MLLCVQERKGKKNIIDLISENAMLEKQIIQLPEGIRAAINHAYHVDELSLISELCEKAALGQQQLTDIKSSATKLVESVRAERKKTQVSIHF